MNEVWKDIEGYEGLYQVSNMGRVRSLDRWINSKGKSKHFIKGKITNSKLTKNGYTMVGLCRKGKQKWCTVHRLVAMAFIPNPYNLPQVNHINEVKSDNRVENLEWCTISYNLSFNDGQKRRAKKLNKTVYQYSLDGKFIAEYPSTHEVERQLDFSNSKISACCRGVRKTAYGYKWSYAS